MRIPKRYGESKKQDCPFCGDFAITINEQEVPVCLKHKTSKIENFKCMCGDWLDLFAGKWGPYFRCMKCGNVTFKRALEINQGTLYQREGPKATPAFKTQFPAGTANAPANKLVPSTVQTGKKEIVVRSDELDFWFE